MEALYIALTDLRQIFRDRKSALFLVIMPIVFTALIGVALRPQEPGDQRLPVVIVTADSGPLAAGLPTLVEASGVLRATTLAPADLSRAQRDLQAKNVVAVVEIPADFAARAMRGEKPKLVVSLDENTPAGQTTRNTLQAAISRFLAAVEMGRMRAEAASAVDPGLGEAERARLREAAALSALEAWTSPRLASTTEKAVVAPQGGADPFGFNQSSPGMLVMFAIFSLVMSSTVLVLERRSGTLQRLLTTSVGRERIIAGHLLAGFAIVAGQGLLLVTVGQLGFGVDYFREPLATLLVVAALALWVSSLGLLIGSLATGADQANIASLIAMFLLSGLGGVWFPLEITGSTFAAVGHLLPSAWAMDGLQSIVVRGLGLGSVLLPVGVMVAYAAGFFAVAAWRLRGAE